jgi:hypothetical protein
MLSCDHFTLLYFNPLIIVTQKVLEKNQPPCGPALTVETGGWGRRARLSPPHCSPLKNFSVLPLYVFCKYSSHLPFEILGVSLFLSFFVLAQFIYCERMGLIYSTQETFNRFLDSKEHFKYIQILLLSLTKNQLCSYF